VLVVEASQVGVDLANQLEADGRTKLRRCPKRDQIAEIVETSPSATLAGRQARSDELLFIPVLDLTLRQPGQCPRSVGRERAGDVRD